jgi:hypothetical protein
VGMTAAETGVAAPLAVFMKYSCTPPPSSATSPIVIPVTGFSDTVTKRCRNATRSGVRKPSLIMDTTPVLVSACNRLRAGSAQRSRGAQQHTRRRSNTASDDNQ